MKISSDRRPMIALFLGVLFLCSITASVSSYRTSSSSVRSALAKYDPIAAAEVNAAVLDPLRRTLIWNLLATTVVAIVVLWAAMATIRRQQRGMQIEASIDGLTGVANRLGGEMRLAEAALEAARKRQPLSVLLLDLDRFKVINDEFGHPMGDRVLQSVARIMSSAVRTNDSVVRWGGEEFLVILPACGIDDARLLAERVRSRIETEHFVNENVAPCTVSVGVVEQEPRENRDSLLDRVDHALYRAKELGRNRVELLSSGR
jgi:diguanylate cyclase (GGDEF)-like protein